MSGNNGYPLIAGIVFLIGLFIIAITLGLMNKNSSNEDECKSDRDCLRGAKCHNGFCKYENGFSCSANSDCISDYCDKTCKTKPTSKNSTAPPPQNNFFISQPPKIFDLPQSPVPDPPQSSVSNSPVPETEQSVSEMDTPIKDMVSSEEISVYDGNFPISNVHNIISLVPYSSYDIILNHDGIHRDDKLITTNITSPITSIATCNGYLFATTDGSILVLHSELTADYWRFINSNGVLKLPNNMGPVLRINSSPISNIMCIQTYNFNYFYDQTILFQIENEPINIIKPGIHIGNYLDINTREEKCSIHRRNDCKLEISEILDVTYNHLNEPVFLTVERAMSGNLNGIFLNKDWKIIASKSN